MNEPSLNSASATVFAFGDLNREIVVTRRVLERLPEEHFAWKPHEKSMPLGRLALHVANLLRWMSDTLSTDELDLANPPKMATEPKDRADLLQTFEQNVVQLQELLARSDASTLGKTWSLRMGAQVLASQPRLLILRVWCLNHLIHHRGQLCLYLRLLNVPVPTVYFNTADDPNWVFE